MGGGSGLLINSHGRRNGRSEFGCEGWFCDVLNGAMVIIFLMIIATAVVGCFKACFSKKRKPRENVRIRIRVRKEARSPLPPAPEVPAPASEHPQPEVRISENPMAPPPEYSETDKDLPPAYSSIRFDVDELPV